MDILLVTMTRSPVIFFITIPQIPNRQEETSCLNKLEPFHNLIKAGKAFRQTMQMITNLKYKQFEYNDQYVEKKNNFYSE